MDEELGSVETGKLADLLLLEGDPLKDIRQTDTISHVVLNGRVYRADTLDEIAPDAVKRARLHFEGRPGATLGTSGDGHGHGDDD
jgi:cytosine/adenosine deaminase-related metal-dependent hydrolase